MYFYIPLLISEMLIFVRFFSSYLAIGWKERILIAYKK